MQHAYQRKQNDMDNPVFISEDRIEMEESYRTNIHSVNSGAKNQHSTAKVENREAGCASHCRTVPQKEIFDPNMKIRFSILIGSIVVFSVWLIVHFGFIQDYSKSKMDDM